MLANRQRHARLELANQITDVRALSATELQITLKSAYAPLLQELALPRPFRFIAPSQFIDGGTAEALKPRSAPARGGWQARSSISAMCWCAMSATGVANPRYSKSPSR